MCGSELQKTDPKALDFYEILKMREQILKNPRTFCSCFIMYCTKGRCTQLKVKKGISAKRPKSLVYVKTKLLLTPYFFREDMAV